MKFINLGALVILLFVSKLSYCQHSDLAVMSIGFDLSEIRNKYKFSEGDFICLTVKNTLHPKDALKKIIVLFHHYENDGDIKTVALEEKYPFDSIKNSYFKPSNYTQIPSNLFFSFKITEQNFTTDSTYVFISKNDNNIILNLQNLKIAADKYKFTATYEFKNGNVKPEVIIENEKDVIAETENSLIIAPKSLIESINEKLFKQEGILISIIVGLLLIIIGILKDRIKKLIENFLDKLGKYGSGKLAEKRFLKRYLDNIIFNHKYLKLVGFNTTGISRPLLEEIFISLRVSNQDIPNTIQSQDDVKYDTTGIPFTKALEKFNFLAILGSPGAGKTTTLSYTLLKFAQKKAFTEFNISKDLLPVFIPLRRVSISNNSILEDITNESTRILPKEILNECPKNYFQQKLKKGGCILLLDGMDEVTSEEAHRIVAQKINDLVADYPNNRFVVTCRIAGWKNLLSGFKVLESQDFNRDELQRFVRGWNTAIITQAERSKLEFDFPEKKIFTEKWKDHLENVVSVAIDLQSRRLIDAIDSNKRLLSIAVNPMLLSLIALVHFNRAILPKGRTILYSQCIELLIDAWDRTRDITSLIEITSTQKEAVLREIAFELQTKGKGEDTRANLELLISKISDKLGINIPANSLLRDIEGRSGLLIERSIDVLGFAHLTLQEYLVSKQIMQNKDAYPILIRNIENPDWREVILLYAGLMDDATKLIQDIISIDTIERIIQAGFCIGDVNACDKGIVSSIIDKLLYALKYNTKDSELIINVLSAIAIDYRGDAISEEQKLSEILIKITANHIDTNLRLYALGILGKARITNAIPQLINILNEDNEIIRTETIKSLIAFGNLAVPFIKSIIDLKSVAIQQLQKKNFSLFTVLQGINTAQSARCIIEFYKINDTSVHKRASVILAQMLKNHNIESELISIDSQELSVLLHKNISDNRDCWDYKNRFPSNGFLQLDTELREVIADIFATIEDRLMHSSIEEQAINKEELQKISFKIWFPALIMHIKRMKTKILSTEFVNYLGYNPENFKVAQYYSEKIKSNGSNTMRYALQGNLNQEISVDFTEIEPDKKNITIIIIRSLFFIIQAFYYFINIYALYWELSHEKLEFHALLFSVCFLCYQLFLATFCGIRCKMKFFSTSIFNILFSWFDLLNILPHITNFNIWIKWILFTISII